MKKRILTICLITLSLALFVSCGSKDGEKESSVAGIPVEGQNGLTMIQSQIQQSAKNKGIIDATLYDSSSLIIYALDLQTGDESLLKYNLKGKVTGEYKLPVSIDTDNYYKRQLLHVVQGKGIYIIDTKSSQVIELDHQMKEVKKYSYATATKSYKMDCMLLLPHSKKLLFTAKPDNDSLYSFDLKDQKISKICGYAEEDGAVEKLESLSDEKTAILYFTSPYEHRRYIDLTSGKLLADSRANKKEYIGTTGSKALMFYKNRSEFTYNDKPVDFKYQDEYYTPIVDVDNAIAVTICGSTFESSGGDQVKSQNADKNVSTGDIMGLYLKAYDLDSGKLLSSTYIQPKGKGYYYEQAFLTSDPGSYDNKSHLVCLPYRNSTGQLEDIAIWDTSTKDTVDDSPFSGMLTRKKDGYTSTSTSSLKNKLEGKYSINIYTNDDKTDKLDDLSYTLVSDDEYSRECLLFLDDILKEYPTGFFDKLRLKGGEKVRFYLCDSVNSATINDNEVGLYYGINDIHYIFINTRGGFSRYDTSSENSTYRLINHEIAHAIDAKLIQSKHEISDKKWLSFLPQGFVFSKNYLNYKDNTKYTPDSESKSNIYFVSPYAKINPMEDRATIFENAMTDPPGQILSNANIQTRMKYYFAQIRTVMKDNTWPETTTWEKALK